MTVTARQKEAAGYLASSGWAPNGICGVVGNLVGESGASLDSTVHRAHADHGSGGIAEWRLDRLTNLIRFAGSADPNDLGVQCRFLIHEVKTDYPQLDAMLRDPARSVENQTANFCWIFERPNKQLANLDGRIRAAKALLADAATKEPSAASAAAAPATIAVGSVAWTGGLAWLGGSVEQLLISAFIVTAISLAQAAWRAHVASRPPLTELESALAALDAARARVAAAKSGVEIYVAKEQAALAKL